MNCMQNPNSNVKMRRIGALEEDEGDDDDDGSDPEMESMGEEEEDDEMNDFDKVLNRNQCKTFQIEKFSRNNLGIRAKIRLKS